MLKQKIGTLVALAILVAACITSTLPRAQADERPPAPTIDPSAWDGVPTRVLMGRRCVNEATWTTADCKVITHIARRLSEAAGIDLRTWLIKHHGTRSLHPERHIPSIDERGRTVPRLSITVRRPGQPPLRVRDDRPWIGDLNADGRQPSMWTWRNTMRWEGRGARLWADILSTVDGVLDGSIPDPSGGRAIIWGGPRVDAALIALRRSQGYIQIEVPGAQNHYFGRPQ